MQSSNRLNNIILSINNNNNEECKQHPNSLSMQNTAAPKSRSTLTVVDNRTGQKEEIPIKHNTVSAMAFKKFVASPERPGLRIYDPAFKNTASATSRITFINGDSGTLLYRGYPIEQLAKKSTFLEVSFLLIYGELPSRDQLSYWTTKIMKHNFIHSDLAEMMQSFRYNAHPMGMLISSVAAMSTIHPDANPALKGQDVYDVKTVRNKNVHRILGCMPTMAAFAYRHRMGRPYVNPSHNPMTYTENFLFMLDRLSNPNYMPHPALARALDVLFILHADHELNCSTSGMRHLASSGVDVYTAIAGSAAALYGPRHGGANEAVLRMLEKIGTVENIPKFIEDVKAKKVRLMGFGHRVYKNYDPRAKIVREIANEVFEITGKEPLIEVAAALEKIALADPYFVERKLYPNVDFYTGTIYKAMGFPTDMFPVLFTIPRTAGWLAHWYEFLDDPENRIVRPRQIYLGHGKRDYVEIDKRQVFADVDISASVSAQAKRRDASRISP